MSEGIRTFFSILVTSSLLVVRLIIKQSLCQFWKNQCFWMPQNFC
ncbi:hypothetical protein HMPREF1546_01376 [Oscillibacter sp. KLE 1745]|nr:hypothetical protein HMPREF1546_01376 [Oscillibacter sp. KLE 1745]